MRTPRNLTGADFARILRRRYEYQNQRQRGSHLRLVSTLRGYEHHVTIPLHSPLNVGTLNDLLGDVAEYIGVSREELMRELFGR